MEHRPSATGSPAAGRVTLTPCGPIDELAAALRTLADALDHQHTISAVTDTATAAPAASARAPGGMTAARAERFVAQLTPTAVEVLAVLCRYGPELTYEALQAQIGIGRQQLGGVLTSLAAARGRLPRHVSYPIEPRLGGTTISGRACRRRAAPGCRRPRSRA